MNIAHNLYSGACSKINGARAYPGKFLDASVVTLIGVAVLREIACLASRIGLKCPSMNIVPAMLQGAANAPVAAYNALNVVSTKQLLVGAATIFVIRRIVNDLCALSKGERTATSKKLDYHV